MLITYRPAGNKITLRTSNFDTNLCNPLNINFFHSGTASLAAAIIVSCKLKGVNTSTAEILLPAYACPDLVSAILFSGAKPVLVDLQKNSTFLSVTDIEKKITDNSVAIISVNFLGISENTDHLQTICKQHNLYLINDSAQWFPGFSDITNWPGDFNIISFGRGKPVSLLHGGAVITTDLEKKQAIDELELSLDNNKESFPVWLKIHIYNTVIKPFYYGILTKIPGLNIGETRYKKLTAICKMDKEYLSLLPENIDKYSSRKTNQLLIHQKIKTFTDSKVIDLYKQNTDHSLLRYPLLITDKPIRDKFLKETTYLGVTNMYKRPLNEIDGLENILNTKAVYTNASDFADHLVTIPTYEDIKPSVIDKVFNRLSYHLSR